MRIVSVGRALPEHRYEQAEITAQLQSLLDVPDELRRRVDVLHERVRVGHRHLALPLEAYSDLATFGQANNAWIRCAIDLGERAVNDALDRAGLGVKDVDIMFDVTVTGLASPALDARLVNRMGLRTDMKRVPIFGLGCVAGVAGISRAVDYLKGHPNEVAVLLSVELCSLNLQRGDLSTAAMISTGLFGDGAAAVVLVGEERARAMGLEAPAVRTTRSVFYPDTEDIMGWDISENGFRIVLSEGVPRVARENLGPDVTAFLAEHDLTPRDVASWVCHPGGPKVLEAMRDSLELTDDDVALSWKVLAEQGNLSSTSVLMVLREVFDGRRPEPGDVGMLVAMGPGFCSEMILVDW
ncbi:Alpha-pyrone synthesis polyketide synthase-like Pks11 [Planctomycetes bacterium Pla163]|uniref:Alpha-pyrone synthesis polyketide synthase-like Pks11 n=2 Tax=Rohdeia mirabilis TaxID=2528008 RepID=A0A518CVK6_9BACT|nr:Alpha-pyrone synthesis polyketide synthase-like Pks11 [Planctomycetes bacterium Pla163]